ncbi:hypothetical protein CMI42_02225 [Candidatus Pacearchaeota archaeon]|jgi:antitoxin component YwqK of YwqJK toxin-antitoxin module|nr:hypothetical protein [Candidatus Pacearchaeota archaeon]|tara:strand:- start:156 stop:599 length:444 start_codon:yes stop_codon:yes gene_type:complete
MSTIYGRYRFADDWIDKVHPQNGLFRVYWKDVVGLHSGGVTFDESDGEGLRWEWNYKDGKKHGISKGWWPSGNLKSKWNWKDDKLDGLFEMWYDNGNYRYLKNYKNGELHGEWISWHENGQMSCKKYFKDGNRIHEVTNWDEKGNII